VIAFGGFFGEWLTYGPAAWFTGLAIWWAAWSLGLMLFAAALRIALEGIAFGASWFAAPARQTMLREAGEWLLRGLYYVGAPTALVWRLLAG
jgi:apolipoprotein N-acyltransferase